MFLNFVSLLDQLLCGEGLDNRGQDEADSAELPSICDPSQPAWLHNSKGAKPEMHQ